MHQSLPRFCLSSKMLLPSKIEQSQRHGGCRNVSRSVDDKVVREPVGHQRSCPYPHAPGETNSFELTVRKYDVRKRLMVLPVPKLNEYMCSRFLIPMCDHGSRVESDRQQNLQSSTYTKRLSEEHSRFPVFHGTLTVVAFRCSGRRIGRKVQASAEAASAGIAFPYDASNCFFAVCAIPNRRTCVLYPLNFFESPVHHSTSAFPFHL